MDRTPTAGRIGKPSLRARWLFRRPISHHLNRISAAVGLGLIRWAARDSNMLRHARDEWKIAFPEKDEMQDAVGQSVFDVVAVFSLEGHSGGSAGYTINFIEKALRFDPFSPLQGTVDEWTEIGEYGGPDETVIFQSKRLSSVFKEIDYNTGKIIHYDIDASPVYVEPSGTSFTKGGTRDLISFPYIKPEKRRVINLDEDGREIPTPQAELAAALRERAETVRRIRDGKLMIAAAGFLEKI